MVAVRCARVSVRPYPGRIGVGSPPVLLSSNGEGIRSYGSVIGAAPQRECAGSMHFYSCMDRSCMKHSQCDWDEHAICLLLAIESWFLT